MSEIEIQKAIEEWQEEIRKMEEQAENLKNHVEWLKRMKKLLYEK